MTKRETEGLGILGFGAAACVACCAGPILAFLGGLGVAGLASTVLVGGAGLVVGAAAVVAIAGLRRRRTTRAAPAEVGPVELGTPTRRTTVSP
jgi:mercuric ion transport protein